jgi:hypothetical protein
MLPLADRTVDLKYAFASPVRGDVGMATIAQFIGWWVLLACTLGPLLTWRFFRFEREERETGAGYLKPRQLLRNKWITSTGLRRPS